VIGKLQGFAAGEQRFQDFHHLGVAGGMDFYADHTGMLTQWYHSPVAKMTVEGDQNAPLGDGLGQNGGVIGPAQSDFFGSDDIVAELTQFVGEFRPEHLVQKQAHEKSGGNEVGDFGTDHAGFGKMQGGLNVGAGEFRVAFEQGIPRIAFGKLAENDFHRDARAFNHRPATTDARVEFNMIVHGEKGFNYLPPGHAVKGEPGSVASLWHLM